VRTSVAPPFWLHLEGQRLGSSGASHPEPLETSFLRFLLRAGAVFAAAMLATWGYVASFPMAFLESGYPSWVAKSTMLRECQLGRIAFFGDSRLHAGIIPALFPVAASNFGLPAGTAIETLSALRRALACPTLPQQVVISLTADHFGPLDQFFWVNDLRYGFISYGELWEAENLAAALGDTESFNTTQTPEGLSGRIRDWMYALHFPSLYAGSLVQGRLFGRYSSNRARLATVLEAHGFSDYGSKPGNDGPGAPDFAGFRKTPLQAAEFEETLSLLNTKNVDVRLLIMPFARTTAANAARDGSYLAYMHDMTLRFPNVRLIGSSVPPWPVSLFVDGAHFTGAGARVFSKRLAACIVDGRIASDCDLDWHGTDTAADGPAL
jgi:hypothetical protein